ncbi:MAG TPA: FGGY family carbohydrate kinase [bacterium]|nr:FGGY family carbohydrate kinase [bacterium]
MSRTLATRSDARKGPSAPLVLAIDQGTHASRALVFDGQGALLAEGVREIGLTRPQPDWAEQDGEEVVASVFAAAEQALAALGPRAADVAAAGLASQRSNAMCWDRVSGAPLSPIYSWQDRRAHAWLRQFQGQAEGVHRASGLFLSPHYGASKLRWSLDNLPAVREALAAGRLAWGPMTSFLTFRMLRERPLLADPQCAARTQLWNLHTGDWDPELLALFGLPAGHLPACVPTCHPYGTFEVAGQAIPLRAVNGDQTAALFAFGWSEPDTTYVNAGTGAFAQRAVDAYPGYAPRLLTGIALQDGPTRVYTLEGTVNGCASALEWATGELGLPDLLARLPEWLAREDADPPLFLNGISGLGAPFWQADFVSRFLGEGEPWQRAVAVVESIAFLLQANMDELARHVPPAARVRISGGVSRLDGLCQRIAELTGVPVHRRDDPEGTARGIAYLAAGRPATWAGDSHEDVFTPRGAPALRERYRRWRDELKRLTGV